MESSNILAGENTEVMDIPIIDQSANADLNPVMLGYASLQGKVASQAAEIDDLRAQIDTLQTELSSKQTLQDADLSAARTAGQDAAECQHADLIQAGIKSLESGRQDFEEALSRADAFGVQLAKIALEPIFNETPQRVETLAALISKSVQRLGQETVLSARLSAQDFGDVAELESYVPTFSASKTGIEIDPLLESGDCVFDLIVGGAELSLDKHWEELAAALRSILEAVPENVPEDAPGTTPA